MKFLFFEQFSYFQILIFLLESVLPDGYFDQSLRALSVDITVLRLLLQQVLPQVASHLEKLRKKSSKKF